MISSRPTIPLLVHEDCMEGVHLDLAKQQASLSNIESNTGNTAIKLGDIQNDVMRIVETSTDTAMNTSSIKTSSSNIATAASSLYSSVGTIEDASTSNTVIGLLKSIVNKLS